MDHAAPMRVAVVGWGEISALPSSRDGYSSRNFSIVRHLAQENEVVFISLAYAEDQRIVDLPEGVRLVEVDVPSSTLSTASRVRATLVTAAGRTPEHSWQQEVIDALAACRVEVVLTLWQVRLPWLSRRFPTVTFLEEDGTQPESPDSLLFRAKQAADRWALNRSLAGSGAAAVISPRELAWARKQLPRVPVHVVPHWVDEAYWSVVPRADDASQHVAVVGQMALERNARGLREIVVELLRHPAERRPQLLVASSSTPHECLRDLPDEAVRFVGAVEDVRTLYASCTATLVPSFVVQGAKTTILQAWAAGIPTVTTGPAAASVGAMDGESVRCADDAAAVARSLIDVANDPDLRVRLVAAGRERLRDHHSAAAVGAAVDEAVAVARARANPEEAL